MNHVDQEQKEGFHGRYLVAVEESRHNCEVNQEEECFTSDNPPVNECTKWHDKVEKSLRDQLVEGSLLHHSRDSDVRNTEEDRVHNDK